MPTRKTLFWLIGAVCLYLIAWNVGSGWLYLLAIMLAGFPITSLIINKVNLRGVDVALAAPASVNTGEELPLTLEVANGSLLPRFLLSLEVNYAGSQSRLFLPVLGPRKSQLIEVTLTEPARGFYPAAEVRLSSTAPAGLTRSRRSPHVECPLLVYPLWYQLQSDWTSGQKNFGYMVSSTIPTRHTASDYLGVRDYRAGDSPRSIHWRTTARSGSLAVIEYARQAAITPVFLVDTFAEADAGMGPDSSFETAVSMAASLAQREALSSRRSGIGCSPEDAAEKGLESSVNEAMRWLAGIEAWSSKPMDLSRDSLPWPEVTPVLFLTSHHAYAAIDRSAFLRSFPHSIVIMLDGERFGGESKERSRFMSSADIKALGGRLEALGAEFLPVLSPDEVPFCLTEL